MRVGVIIVAGGSGSRMGGDVPKQFLTIAGRPILVHTIERFAATLPDAQFVVVLPAEQFERWSELCKQYDVQVPHTVCVGGQNRFDSVKNGLAALGEVDIIAVHDGVRPLASSEMIGRAIDTAVRYKTAIPVVAPVDSFRILEGDKGRSSHFDRSQLRAVQTPQVFDATVLRDAYRQPYDPEFTDDASVVERSGVAITLCEGEYDNIKITTPSDIAIAEALIAMRKQ